MLDRHLIDGAIVSRKKSAFSREPVIATTRDELIAAAGSHFDSSSHLEELVDSYKTYPSTIAFVRSLKGGHRRVALVGTPCQITTIRKMQCLDILPANVIDYTIGLFCTENLAFDEQGRKKMEQRLHFNFEDVDKLNVKEDFSIKLENGRTIHVPFEDLDELARPAALVCTDFANDYADLSAGGLGSPEGYTTILVRSDKGRAMYSDALLHGYIEERRLRGAAGQHSERDDMMAQVATFARWKRERGTARRRELGQRVP
jgi:coenzyme F420 hydrogenase subunit beta